MSELALGARWSPPEQFSDTVAIRGVTVRLAGFSTCDATGRVVTGSAADTDCSPTKRAYSELLERTSIIDALALGCASFEARDMKGRFVGSVPSTQVFPEPDSEAPFRYSLSNGVAANECFQSACRSAYLELVERDRILRSWFGYATPEPLDLGASIPSAWHGDYDFRLVRFPPPDCASIEEVVGLIGLPLRPKNPLACGFGAGLTLDAAVERAARECIQVLGFLWDEALPERPPAFDTTPDFHQLTYLLPGNHVRIRNWLDGGNAQSLPRLRGEPTRAERVFVDLTPPHLRGRLWVIKAMTLSELPLTFGYGHPSLPRSCPPELLIHPIS